MIEQVFSEHSMEAEATFVATSVELINDEVYDQEDDQCNEGDSVDSKTEQQVFG